MILHRTATVDGLELFFREAGPAGAPTLVLLPGFPSSSHQYRRLLDALDGSCHLLAPDYPGFGYSDSPPVDAFPYTFDRLSEVVEGLLLDVLGLEHFFLYVFDFGAPIGYRTAARNPERIQGLIVQNGNASTCRAART